MKHLLARILLLPFLVVLSCEQFEDDFIAAENILNGQDYAVHKGILTFRDRAALAKLAEELKDKTPKQLNDWESSLNFKSLRSLHEEAIQREEIFLEEMAVKHPGNTTLTRKELGYTKFTTDLINKGLFVVNEFETIDANVPAPYYATFVNTDGVIRIGDNIVMPTLNAFKILKNGNASRIEMLRNATNSDEKKGIYINAIKRNTFGKNEDEIGRSKAWTYCDNNHDGYRLIVYEEVYLGNVHPDEIPCYGEEASYWLRFRSLKRILGTWQNHNTGLWNGVSTVKIEHWATCYYGSGSNCSPQTVNSYYTTPVDLAGYAYTIPYGNDQTHYFLLGYELGPCNSGGLDSCLPTGPLCDETPDPLGYPQYVSRSHDVYGKGGTYCHVGE